MSESSQPTKKSTNKQKPKNEAPKVWLVYVALFYSGFALLANHFQLLSMHRWTLQLALAMIGSAVVLMYPKSKSSGIIAAVIIWTATLIAIFY